MDPSTLAWLVVLGAAVGLAAGLLGIGGGMLMVPFMTMLLSGRGLSEDLVVKVAIATSLTSILFTSASSIRAHHRAGAVRWDVVRALAPGILVGSLLAAQVAHRISGHLLGLAFGIFLAFMATQMLLGKRGDADAPARPLPSPGALIAMGALIGSVATLVGAGGGFLTVPFLTSRNVRIQSAVATSAACGFPIAAAGAIGYLWSGRDVQGLPGMVGYLYLPALAVVVVGSMATAPMGARLAHSMGTGSLRRVFAVLLYSLAAYMLWRALR